MFITINGYLQFGLDESEYGESFLDDDTDEIDKLIAQTNKTKKKEQPNITAPEKEDDKFSNILININNIAMVKIKEDDPKLHYILLYDGFSVVTNEKFDEINKKISNSSLGVGGRIN